MALSQHSSPFYFLRVGHQPFLYRHTTEYSPLPLSLSEAAPGVTCMSSSNSSDTIKAIPKGKIFGSARVRTQNSKSVKVPKGYSPKFYPKRKGPFYITELGPHFTYRLRCCADHSEVKCLINATRLRKYVNPGTLRREPVEPEVLIPERQEEEQPQPQRNYETIQRNDPQDSTLQEDEALHQQVPAGDQADQPKALIQKMHSQDNQEIDCDRQAVRILRDKMENSQRKYLVRWEDSWEPEENLSKLREKFPCRVLTKRITASVPYCKIRWIDTWEPAEKCNDELIQKYNRARANKKRKAKTRPQPRHEHFLRSKISQLD